MHWISRFGTGVGYKSTRAQLNLKPDACAWLLCIWNLSILWSGKAAGTGWQIRLVNLVVMNNCILLTTRYRQDCLLFHSVHLFQSVSHRQCWVKYSKTGIYIEYRIHVNLWAFKYFSKYFLGRMYLVFQIPNMFCIFNFNIIIVTKHNKWTSVTYQVISYLSLFCQQTPG